MGRRNKPSDLKDVIFNKDRTVKKNVKNGVVFSCPCCNKDLIVIETTKGYWIGKYEEK